MTCQTTQCHSPEDSNLQKSYVYSDEHALELLTGGRMHHCMLLLRTIYNCRNFAPKCLFQTCVVNTPFIMRSRVQT
jgi:hypothetical protein